MKIIATLPTYNERTNLETLIDAVLATHPQIEVLVIDDNSPDGTWQLVSERAASDPRIHLLHRTNEKGRGSAGVAGFREALRLGADYVVEMDADWSHHPRHIAAMIDEAQSGADVVVGSRLVPGGGERGRSAVRRWITFLANAYIRTLLRLPLRDCTSGFRVFRRRVIEGIDWARVESKGPALVQEVLVACKALGAVMKEHPILFEERKAGASTLTSRILVVGLLAQWRLRFRPAPVRST